MSFPHRKRLRDVKPLCLIHLFSVLCFASLGLPACFAAPWASLLSNGSTIASEGRLRRAYHSADYALFPARLLVGRLIWVWNSDNVPLYCSVELARPLGHIDSRPLTTTYSSSHRCVTRRKQPQVSIASEGTLLTPPTPFFRRLTAFAWSALAIRGYTPSRCPAASCHARIERLS